MAKRLGILLVVLVLALGLAELVLHKVVADSYRPMPPFATFEDPGLRTRMQKRVEREAKNPADLQGNYDQELGWAPKPGAHKGQFESGVINSIGARGAREYTPLPGPGITRVVCMGDSYTFGTEVEDDESWPAQMEASDPSLEAINLGVGGYGTGQALLRFRRDGKGLGAQVAIMGLLLENISRNVNRLRTFYVPDKAPPSVKPRFFLRDGQLEVLGLPYASRGEVFAAALSGELRNTLAERDHWAGDDPWPAWSSIARFVAQRRALERRSTSLLWSDPDGEPYRLTMALLEAFQREAHEAGAERTLVVLFAPGGIVQEFRRAEPPWFAELLADLDQRGIEHLDLVRPIVALPRKQPLFVELHYTPAVNALIAKGLAHWLGAR